MKKAIDYVRNGKGPYFLEFPTYRWREHCGPFFDNHIGYREVKEFEFWKKKDCLNYLKKKISKNNKQNIHSIKKIEKLIKGEVVKAFNIAKKSKFPKQSDAYKGVYATKKK